MNEQRYSEEQAREILQRASKVQLTESDFNDLHLEQMAQELGISEYALTVAREQYLTEQREKKAAETAVVSPEDDLNALGITPEIRREFEAHRRQEFYMHLTVYGVMSVFFVVINLLTSPDQLWFYWPILGWGIGVAIHAAITLFPKLDDDYEDDLIKWHTKRVKRRGKLTAARDSINVEKF